MTYISIKITLPVVELLRHFEEKIRWHANIELIDVGERIESFCRQYVGSNEPYTITGNMRARSNTLFVNASVIMDRQLPSF